MSDRIFDTGTDDINTEVMDKFFAKANYYCNRKVVD